jgi:LemA protein
MSNTLTLVVFGGALLILLWWMANYNGFIAKRNQARHALSGIDVQFKKRHDLIPNLVETVKGFMEHERNLLSKLTELRESAASHAIDSPERSSLEQELGSTLRAISARAEAYPLLQSSQNFLHLQQTLTEIEEQISAARRAYNGAVETFNNALEMFPSSLVGQAMNLQKLEFFAASEAESAPVPVKFS